MTTHRSFGTIRGVATCQGCGSKTQLALRDEGGVSLDVRYFVVKEARGFIGQMPQGLPVMNNFVTFDMKLSELNIACLIRGVE